MLKIIIGKSSKNNYTLKTIIFGRYLLTFTFCTNHGIQPKDQKVPLSVPW